MSPNHPYSREKPRLWLGVRGGAEGLVTIETFAEMWSSAPKQFGARRLVPERKAPPKRGQVYELPACERRVFRSSAAGQCGNSGLGGWFLDSKHSVPECCRAATEGTRDGSSRRINPGNDSQQPDERLSTRLPFPESYRRRAGSSLGFRSHIEAQIGTQFSAMRWLELVISASAH